MTASVSAPLPPASAVALAAAVQRLSRTDRLLVAMDFDGTLAPFVDVPRGARALPESKAALDRLEGLPRTWVAYVSGRPLDSLRTVTEADEDALLVASHGVEIRFGRDGVSLDLTDDERRTLERLGEVLGEVVDALPGLKLEVKPVGFGVHYRLVADEHGPDVVRRAREAAASVSDALTIRDGKDIIEFSVRGADKGDGIERLREYTEATAVIFAGDDVTDEDAFRVLRAGEDVGIKVGTGETAAQYRVADERAIATLLTLLAEARAAATA